MLPLSICCRGSKPSKVQNPGCTQSRRNWKRWIFDDFLWQIMIFFSLKAFQFLYIFREKNDCYVLLYVFVFLMRSVVFCLPFFLSLSFSLNIDFIPKKSKWSKISKSSMKVHKVFGLKNHTFSLGVNFHCLINNTCSCKSEFLMGDVNSKEHLLFKISKN